MQAQVYSDSSNLYNMQEWGKEIFSFFSTHRFYLHFNMGRSALCTVPKQPASGVCYTSFILLRGSISGLNYMKRK